LALLRRLRQSLALHYIALPDTLFPARGLCMGSPVQALMIGRLIASGFNNCGDIARTRSVNSMRRCIFDD